MKRLFLVLCTISMAGCSAGGGETDDSLTDDGELRNGGISSITVNQSEGFRPPPPEGSCWENGRWSVDYASKRLTGDACVDGRTKRLDSELSDAQFAKVKSAVTGLRTTRRPSACPTDIPVRSVTIKKGSTETHYVEERSACSGDKAVTEATIRKLVTLMHELSAGNDNSGGGDIALGLLNEPGDQLKGKTFELARGKSLSFEAAENQIRCIRDIDIRPASAVTLEEKVIQDREEGMLGGTTRRLRTLTVSESAAVGSTVTLETNTCFQVRNDPAWKFSFKIKVK